MGGARTATLLPSTPADFSAATSSRTDLVLRAPLSVPNRSTSTHDQHRLDGLEVDGVAVPDHIHALVSASGMAIDVIAV